MAILIPTDTRLALGEGAAGCESRSLFMSRFADPIAKDSGVGSPRREWFESLRSKRPWSSAVRPRAEWLSQTATAKEGCVLYAQLQSRLMVNMAGGVMENAGLCLDRFGLPYIPGTAVKGCARRAALAALHEWCDTGTKPNGEDNLFSKACEPFASPGDMLAAVGMVFGWGDQEWSPAKDGKTGCLKSDFAWACGKMREETWTKAAESLPIQLGLKPTAADEQPRWKSLPNFAGSVSFLPAHPVDLGKTGPVDRLAHSLPEVGKLELEVVTCHHPEYYDRKMEVALDTEDPVPVLFPAVAAGHIFAFGLLPLRRGSQTTTLHFVRCCLSAGLSTFGLGAKTAAGYGWFDASDKTSQFVEGFLEKRVNDLRDQQLREKEERDKRLQHEENVRRKKEFDERLSQLTPDQQEDAKVAMLSSDQFRSALDNWSKREPEEQKAIIRAMRLEPHLDGSRRSFWGDLKEKAQKKGGKFAQTEQAIRQLSKQLYPGKEGKMP